MGNIEHFESKFLHQYERMCSSRGIFFTVQRLSKSITETIDWLDETFSKQNNSASFCGQNSHATGKNGLSVKLKRGSNVTRCEILCLLRFTYLHTQAIM